MKFNLQFIFKIFTKYIQNVNSKFVKILLSTKNRFFRGFWKKDNLDQQETE